MSKKTVHIAVMVKTGNIMVRRTPLSDERVHNTAIHDSQHLYRFISGWRKYNHSKIVYRGEWKRYKAIRYYTMKDAREDWKALTSPSGLQLEINDIN